MSRGQDLVYAICDGRIKTPKSILYRYAIESLTNSAKLMTINNRLGHGVSVSILEKLAVENTFRALEKQLDNNILFNGVSKKVFTMSVHDNIDGNEETLSGKFKLSSSFNINFCDQKCNLIATRPCYFPCNGIEEIISYRKNIRAVLSLHFVLKFYLTDY